MVHVSVLLAHVSVVTCRSYHGLFFGVVVCEADTGTKLWLWFGLVKAALSAGFTGQLLLMKIGHCNRARI